MPAMPTPPARVDIVREFPDTTWADDGPTRGVERIVEDGLVLSFPQLPFEWPTTSGGRNYVFTLPREALPAGQPERRT